MINRLKIGAKSSLLMVLCLRSRDILRRRNLAHSSVSPFPDRLAYELRTAINITIWMAKKTWKGAIWFIVEFLNALGIMLPC